MIDTRRFKNQPLGDWQVKGIEKLVQQKQVAVFDDVGMGKTYQEIMAASILHERGELDTVLVVCPAGVKGVWNDPQTGEIYEHEYLDYSVCTIDALHPEICEPKNYLRWYITSYAYLRKRSAKELLMSSLRRFGGKFKIVADESSHLKNHASSQSKSTVDLRDLADRRSILNATPMPNSVMDYYGQFRFLDPRAIRHLNYFQFRNRFAKMGGYMGKNVVGVRDEETLKKWLAPWILQRTREMPKTYATIPVTMPAESWRVYQEMREEMIAWWGAEYSSGIHAGVKVLRLAQVTSGLLGGFRDTKCCRCGVEYDFHEDSLDCEEFLGTKLPPKEIDHVKATAVIDWILDHRNLKGIIWCRFTAEIEQLSRMMNEAGLPHVLMYGKVPVAERITSWTSEHPVGLQYVVGQQATGSEGLNLKAADFEIFVSNDYNWKTRYQAEGRARPNPAHPVLYVDVLMTSPDGKKTIDHHIKKRLNEKKNLEDWTSQDWKELLTV